VGGAVRDLLLHREHDDPWLGVPDLDLVVEPADPAEAQEHAAEEPSPAQRLARRLRQQLEPERLVFYQEHGAYGTVELELLLEDGPVLLDVASARRERYPVAAENPQVAFGLLADDLARRDFTINAMALRLEPGAPVLLDPHGGRADLGGRVLRFLHDHSVRDDPTRVLRGARYAARMGFALAPESLVQLHDTLARWPWRWRPGDPPCQAPPALGTRLRMELELMLAREPWPRAMAVLQQWGALLLLDPGLQADPHWRRRLGWASRLSLPLLPALLAGAAEPVALAERLQVPHRHHRLLERFGTLRRRLDALPEAATIGRWTPAQWCALLEAPGGSPEAVALALAAGVGPRRPLLRWWLRWRHLRAGATAAEIMASENLQPGPDLGERLRTLRRERLARERL